MQQEHGTRVEGLGTQQDALIKALDFFLYGDSTDGSHLWVVSHVDSGCVTCFGSGALASVIQSEA